MTGLTAIAMSGGVDSLVAASILTDTGMPLIGIHFITGYESEPAGQTQTLQSPELLGEAAAKLGISLRVFDMRAQFKSLVVEPFVAAYFSGKTPNPCMMCNPAIKFGALLEKAGRELGATSLATGHYARTKENGVAKMRLFKAMDLTKDQSYFLGFLKQSQLKAALFPLGKLTKDRVREMAKKKGLDCFIKEESQETCFIKDDNYREFLKKQPEFQNRPGEILNLDEVPIGRHQGVFAFTVGQRRGINIPAIKPYYVIRVDPKNNWIMVGEKKDLLSKKVHVENINWISTMPEDFTRVATRIRYRHKEAMSTLSLTGKNTATIIFDEPQLAVTPGQGAVFYLDDEVLGAGWIARAHEPK